MPDTVTGRPARSAGAADVAALAALSQRSAHYAILNAVGLDASARDRGADSVSGEGR